MFMVFLYLLYNTNIDQEMGGKLVSDLSMDTTVSRLHCQPATDINFTHSSFKIWINYLFSVAAQMVQWLTQPTASSKVLRSILR
jgi:hypothetical protein